MLSWLQSREDSAQLQRISHQLSGLMASLADVEKLALALQADASASRKALPHHACMRNRYIMISVTHCVMHDVDVCRTDDGETQEAAENLAGDAAGPDSPAVGAGKRSQGQGVDVMLISGCAASTSLH